MSKAKRKAKLTVEQMVGRRVIVANYPGSLHKVHVGMVGTIISTAPNIPNSSFPIRVQFAVGGKKFTEIFASTELMYVNNKPVVLPCKA